jgi:hypothetical protein
MVILITGLNFATVLPLSYCCAGISQIHLVGLCTYLGEYPDGHFLSEHLILLLLEVPNNTIQNTLSISIAIIKATAVSLIVI